MKSPVHILVTVRKPELLPAALLVFRTLRTGFPHSPVFVWGNALDVSSMTAVQHAVNATHCHFQNLPATSHDEWIENGICKLNEPFWICDTDVVFFMEMMEPRGEVGFSGRREPEFDEEFTDTVHVERLHTAVMYLNPSVLRQQMREWMALIPAPWRYSAQFPFVRQNFVPVANGRTRFYDTMAGAYHAFGGTPFDALQNASFEHLHCGTYADEVVKLAPSLKDLSAVHAVVFANPDAARGLAQKQAEYYAARTT